MIQPIVLITPAQSSVLSRRNRRDATIEQECGERADADGHERGRHCDPRQL